MTTALDEPVRLTPWKKAALTRRRNKMEADYVRDIGAAWDLALEMDSQFDINRAREKFLEDWDLALVWDYKMDERARWPVELAWDHANQLDCDRDWCELVALRQRRRARREREDQLLLPRDERALYVRAHNRRVADGIRWCKRGAVCHHDKAGMEGAEFALRFTQTGYQRRHHFASSYHLLEINARGRISYENDVLRVGPWEYRCPKKNECKLQFRYIPWGDDRDADNWRSETNAERRRVIEEACGPRCRGMMKSVQADDFGRLYQCAKTGQKQVRVVCPSTGRVYWLRVPLGCKTAHEAVAASFGLTVETYRPTLQK